MRSWRSIGAKMKCCFRRCCYLRSVHAVSMLMEKCPPVEVWHEVETVSGRGDGHGGRGSIVILIASQGHFTRSWIGIFVHATSCGISWARMPLEGEQKREGGRGDGGMGEWGRGAAPSPPAAGRPPTAAPRCSAPPTGCCAGHAGSPRRRVRPCSRGCRGRGWWRRDTRGWARATGGRRRAAASRTGPHRRATARTASASPTCRTYTINTNMWPWLTEWVLSRHFSKRFLCVNSIEQIIRFTVVKFFSATTKIGEVMWLWTCESWKLKNWKKHF